MAIGNFLQLSFSSGMPRTDIYGVTRDRPRTVFAGKETNAKVDIPEYQESIKTITLYLYFHFFIIATVSLYYTFTFQRGKCIYQLRN